jgi:hypothetical protein
MNNNKMNLVDENLRQFKLDSLKRVRKVNRRRMLKVGELKTKTTWKTFEETIS